MGIEVVEVRGKRDLKAFVYLPEKIHKGHKNWVHPIYLDERDFFNPKKNPHFKHNDVILYIARKDGEVVGRCMGVIHHEYNKKHNEKFVRFSFVETYNDQEVFHELLEAVANWGKEKGMEKIVGPLAFSDKDPQGLIIEGFDEPMVIASTCNYPYMVDLTLNEGFLKKVNLVVYKVDIPNKLPPIYEKIFARFQKNNVNLQVKEFTSRRKVRPYIRPALQLVNDTFTEIYGFTPFSKTEMDDFANRYLYLINPRYIKIVVNENDDVVGMIVGMSDIGKGIQKARGRLIPLGFIHLLLAGRKSKQLNLLLGAIDPKYQGRGIDVIMGMKMMESAKSLGKEYIDSHLELEYNTKVRAEMERMGGVVYKKYRLFEKEI